MCHRHGLHLIDNRGCEWYLRLHGLVKSVWASQGGHCMLILKCTPCLSVLHINCSENYSLGFLKTIGFFQRLALKPVLWFRGWETLLSVWTSASAIEASRHCFLRSSLAPAFCGPDSHCLRLRSWVPASAFFLVSSHLICSPALAIAEVSCS